MKFIKYIFLLFFLSEVALRVIGFGNPILYTNNTENYFPKFNQNLVRYKKSKLIINDYGMRTSLNWSNYQDKYKIIFFGDSTTFGGSYIDNENLFSEKLCTTHIPKALCGNLGVNGYLIDNLYFRIKNTDKNLYDHIIIFVSSNMNAGKSNFHNFPFYEDYDYIFLRGIFEIINHFLFKFKIMDRYHSTSFNKKIDSDKKNYNQNQNLIRIINEISKNKKVSLFILPTLEELSNSINKISVLNSLSFNNVEKFNLYSILKKKKYHELYFNNGHLNKKGHDYLSKIIYDYIK